MASAKIKGVKVSTMKADDLRQVAKSSNSAKDAYKAKMELTKRGLAVEVVEEAAQ